MAKRISSEERVIAYFMGNSVETAQQMLRTAAAIVKQRTPPQQRTVKKLASKPRVTVANIKADAEQSA